MLAKFSRDAVAERGTAQPPAPLFHVERFARWVRFTQTVFHVELGEGTATGHPAAGLP
jgi:hypothetical protein